MLACASLSACGDKGGPEPQWLSAEAQPVDLRLRFDPERGRAKVITSAGGSTTVIAADGTRYQLNFPAGALLSDERISLIPVTSVQGLPLDGEDFAAVHIKPDGLRLLKPAMLRIDTPEEVPAAERVAFAYSSNGLDAHLYPQKRNAHRVELPILHFSGYGIGRAVPDDPGLLILQRAANDEDRLSARLAEALNRERQQQLDGQADAADATVQGDLVLALLEYYDHVLRPLMALAERDERMAECALNRYLGWEQQLQIFAVVPDGIASSGPAQLARRRQEAQASMTKIVQNATEARVARAVERCREEQAFDAASEVLALQRQAHLLGIASKVDIEAVMKEIERCLNFEVEFDSIIETKTPSGGTYHHVRAKVPVSVSLEGIIGAAGALEYVAYRARGNPKKDLGVTGPVVTPLGDIVEEFGNGEFSAAGTRASTFVVHALEWNMNTREVPGTNCNGADEMQEQRVAEEFTVTFAPGVPIELLRFSPKHAGEQTTLGKVIEALGVAVQSDEVIEGGRQARVDGPSVSEETRWADEWASRHADSQISSGEQEAESERVSPVFKLVLKLAERGVWRARFEQEDTPVYGYSGAEESYLIVRHTPK